MIMSFSWLCASIWHTKEREIFLWNLYIKIINKKPKTQTQKQTNKQTKPERKCNWDMNAIVEITFPVRKDLSS